MGRRALTDEEKADRAAKKKADKIAEREVRYNAQKAEWARQAEESRQNVLNEIPQNLAKQFISAIEKSSSITGNDFVDDIRRKWDKFGNLSLNQISAFVRIVSNSDKKETISDAIESFFEIGQEENLTNLKVQKVELHTKINEFGQPETRTVIFLIFEKSGVRFRISTNNKKMIKVFQDAMDDGKNVNVQATTKWHPPGADFIILKPVKIKIEVIDR